LPPTALMTPAATFCQLDLGFISHTSCPLENYIAESGLRID
jgi:hypothetical protein